MHARIYFLIIILTSVVIATFNDEKIALLTQENETLRQSLEAQKSVAGANEHATSDPFRIRPGYSPVAFESPMILENDAQNQAEPDEFRTNSQEKIEMMQSHLKRYRHEAMGYQMMIDALKNEINIKDGELQQLRSNIAKYEAENQIFAEALTQKQHDLNATVALLNNREKEIALEKKLIDLSQNLRIAEADACYARAQLTELAAHKILFSAGRKKQYFREALEGYKKAFSLGKEEAAEDISKLQKSLFPALASAH